MLGMSRFFIWLDWPKRNDFAMLFSEKNTGKNEPLASWAAAGSVKSTTCSTWVSTAVSDRIWPVPVPTVACSPAGAAHSWLCFAQEIYGRGSVNGDSSAHCWSESSCWVCTRGLLYARMIGSPLPPLCVCVCVCVYVCGCSVKRRRWLTLHDLEKNL